MASLLLLRDVASCLGGRRNFNLLEVMLVSSQTQTVLTLPDALPVVGLGVAQEPRLFKGLCVNCDDRFICTFRRPESGVWFCEEYR